jgi:hypothetical protein
LAARTGLMARLSVAVTLPLLFVLFRRSEPLREQVDQPINLGLECWPHMLQADGSDSIPVELARA